MATRLANLGSQPETTEAVRRALEGRQAARRRPGVEAGRGEEQGHVPIPRPLLAQGHHQVALAGACVGLCVGKLVDPEDRGGEQAHGNSRPEQRGLEVAQQHRTHAGDDQSVPVGQPDGLAQHADGTARIVDWLQQARDRYPNLVMVAELAQAMPKQGLTSTFRYARHFAIFEVTAILLKTPYVEVRPAVWKKAMGLTQKKADSIAACRRLFPTIELIPKGCRLEHDGIAEALLIAEWARRKNL